MRTLGLTQGIFALTVGVMACSARRTPPVAAAEGHARAPLCPGGGVELATFYRQRDRDGCLTITERHLRWKGDVLELPGWRLDAARDRLSFPPFITDEPTPVGRRTRVGSQVRGLPCYAAVSPSGDFVAWPEKGGCEPREICVARAGAAEGTCFVEPADRRPALQQRINQTLGAIDRFYWLERDGPDYRCTQWTVTSREPPAVDSEILIEVQAVRRRGTREERLSAGIASDPSLPGVQLSGPSKQVYENGTFVTGGIPLCQAPIGIDWVDETALWTDHGPWYLTEVACEATLASLGDDARRTAALVTRAAGCGEG